MKEGIFKMLNDGITKINAEQFVIKESWRKTKWRIQEQYKGAKIKYSYKTQQFTIVYDLPADFKEMKIININDSPYLLINKKYDIRNCKDVKR